MGGPKSELERLPGGSVNHTWRLRRSDCGDIVIRVAVDPRRENEFVVESWAARAAQRIGIPVAEPLVTGVREGRPFLVSRFLRPDREDVDAPWVWLGRFADQLGDIGLGDAPPALHSRFGPDSAAAWLAHVEYNLASLTPDDALLRDGAYDAVSDLHDRWEVLLTASFRFGLAHGDLAPRNLISRGEHRAPALIDWGAATLGPTPWVDAVAVLLAATLDEPLPPAEWARFATAAGVDTPADREVLVSMAALHLVDTARWARDRRPDRYEELVRRCRTGLRRLRVLT